MAASHYKLDNLVVIIDNNGLQIDGNNEDVMGVSPLDEKFKSFGFNVVTCNGHDFDEIHEAMNITDRIEGKPSIIIAQTIKGKGVSFMENEAGWHGQAPNKEQTEKALIDINN